MNEARLRYGVLVLILMTLLAAGIGAAVSALPARGASQHWRTAHFLPWYGPGFYGKPLACAKGPLTRWTRGVAHRTLPCGTLIEFRLKDGHRVRARVVDRGPYPVGIPRRLMPLDVTARTMCFNLQRPYGRYPKGGCSSLRNVKWRVVERGK